MKTNIIQQFTRLEVLGKRLKETNEKLIKAAKEVAALNGLPEPHTREDALKIVNMIREDNQ